MVRLPTEWLSPARALTRIRTSANGSSPEDDNGNDECGGRVDLERMTTNGRAGQGDRPGRSVAVPTHASRNTHPVCQPARPAIIAGAVRSDDLRRSLRTLNAHAPSAASVAAAVETPPRMSRMSTGWVNGLVPVATMAASRPPRMPAPIDEKIGSPSERAAIVSAANRRSKRSTAMATSTARPAAASSVNSISGKEERDRHPDPTEGVWNCSALVEVIVERELELRDERAGIVLIVGNCDTDEGDTIWECAVGLPQQGSIGSTGNAPRSPDIDHGRATTIRDQSLKLCLVDRGEFGTQRGRWHGSTCRDQHRSTGQ